MNGTPLFLVQRSQDLICEWCRLRNPFGVESTQAVRAMWIPSFRRHPIFSSYFRENDFYPIHQFHR